MPRIAPPPVAALPGLGFVPGWWYTHQGTDGTATVALDALHLHPFLVDTPAQFDRIGIEVTAAGSTGAVLRLGIYANQAGAPGAVLLDAGTVDATTTGAKTITIAHALPRGWVWLACVAQGAASGVRTKTFPTSGPQPASSITNNNGGGFTVAGLSGPLPANPAPLANGAQAPKIHLRAA